MLKVESGYPQLRLPLLVDAVKPAEAQTPPALVLPAHMLTSKNAIAQSSLSHILLYLNSLSPDAIKALPGSVLPQLDNLKKSLSKLGELGTPAKLKSVLENSGVFLESKLLGSASKSMLNTDLKGILLQILHGFSEMGQSKGQSGLSNSVPEAYRMPLDSRRSESVKLEVLLRVESALGRITHQQKTTLEENSSEQQRWFFELPATSTAGPVPISLSIYQENRASPSSQESSNWGAEFSIKLQHHGLIGAKLSLVRNTVFVSLQSAQPQTVRNLASQKKLLNDKFHDSGLTLGALESTLLSEASINE